MNNYLLQLLKEVKTIIIPGLGALTLTNEQTGEMMFMSYLKFDDGTLAKHIAEKEGLDINDAKNRIAKFVREVTAQLDKGESYDMYQFGKFAKSDGEVVFEQWQVGSPASQTPEAQVIENAPVVVPEPEPIVETVIEKHIVPEEKPLEKEISPEEENIPAEANTIREEIPVSGQEAVAASIASALVEDAEVIEEHPVVELDDKGFQTEDVPAEPVAEPEAVHESPLPINEVPEVTKPEPEVAPSPKDILAARDAEKEKKKEKAAAKTTKPAKPAVAAAPKQRRKTSVFAYILWGIVVLILGGGTYVAVNFDTLKKDFPILADLAGERTTGEETAKAEAPAADTTGTSDETETQEPVTEPETAPEVAQPEPVVEQPAPTPPAASGPKPSRTRASTPSSSVSIGKPDPAKPFHVIGGSFSSEANANRFARELISKGQPSVIVGEFNGMFRVSIASFSTKEEALQAHSSLKSIVSQAWVFKWP